MTALARRTLPVADPAPVQLVLGLRCDHPMRRAHVVAPAPKPPVLRVARYRRAEKAAA